MDAWIWVVIAVVVVVLVAIGAWAAWRKQRSVRLRERFGPEYGRVVADRGGRRKAEAELSAREKRREKLEIRPLDAEVRDRYAETWRGVQARFVDEPVGALEDADRLVMEVMRKRGYPMDDFEQRAADISVDHPEVVENYRAGHSIYVAHGRGEAGTEDLRQAMVHYRSLFEDLLEREETTEDEPVREVR
jgi:hypothetical protein